MLSQVYILSLGESTSIPITSTLREPKLAQAGGVGLSALIPDSIGRPGAPFPIGRFVWKMEVGYSGMDSFSRM